MKYYLISEDLVDCGDFNQKEVINKVELTKEELVDIGIMTILGRKNNSKLREKIRKILELWK